MLVYVLALIMLSGCQAMDYRHFGMSQSEWQHLNQKQQALLVNKYLQVKKHRLLTINRVFPTPYQKIEVNLLDGSALMWPNKKQFKFMPIDIVLSAGSCKEVELFGPGKLVSTKTEICYNGKYVSLDPSHWQKKFADGGMLIATNHLWKQGMVYKDLSSKGYAGLRNTSVFIRSL